jgi:hypothetical protein
MPVKQLIQTVTVGASGAASIEFAAIPQDAVDLVLVLSARSNRASAFDQVYFQFNSDTAQANYSQKNLVGRGASVISNGSSNFVPYIYSQGTADGVIPAATSTASTFGSLSLSVPNYSSSVAKSISFDAVGENNATASGQQLTAGSWNNTSPITSIVLTMNSTNFVYYSTASLYKIKYD